MCLIKVYLIFIVPRGCRGGDDSPIHRPPNASDPAPPLLNTFVHLSVRYPLFPLPAIQDVEWSAQTAQSRYVLRFGSRSYSIVVCWRRRSGMGCVNGRVGRNATLLCAYLQVIDSKVSLTVYHLLKSISRWFARRWAVGSAHDTAQQDNRNPVTSIAATAHACSRSPSLSLLPFSSFWPLLSFPRSQPVPAGRIWERGQIVIEVIHYLSIYLSGNIIKWMPSGANCPRGHLSRNDFRALARALISVGVHLRQR